MPQVTSLAPDFKAEAVIGQQIKEIKLSDYKGKWVVLFFWPLDFTFVCPTEIIEYDAKLDEFKKLGAEVLGVSVDSAFTHLAWKNTPRKQGGLGEIKYPLIADITKSIARDYGVLTEGGVALRGTFIIDPSGTIRQATINDLPVGRNIDEAIRLVKAFQYVEKHGEVCPANWDEGKKTMKADPEKSKEYFSSVN
ncbi:peroxiredoxin [Leptospira wolffii]|uniref:Thioredoxin peroxidase n=1 Tax=Leptospira wolffii TaxID=409998 RepID=A0ABV5BTG3_9LEPT|nr:peroxiredoxin [Leptospira wolffii]TGK62741.1 peroxiredoxin [Leptospira wolffii]TGK73872.1 peroxiredoxin [Leptospira wolffii]TGK75027.1 peroxiredoxin [Leptospira wolffii]TGL28734.1 peroxiredoxin [Leptospira wolffii]TGL49555.1 peroxiredoxin [Leptospira wolffii]